MKFLKLILFFVLTLLPISGYCAESSTSGTGSGVVSAMASADNRMAAINSELSNLQSISKGLKYDHWAQTIIPGQPQKGLLLYQWLMYVVVFPVFAIFLIWGIIQSLNSEGSVDYVDLIKRIFIFAIFTGFGSIIFGYLAGIQSGMASIVNFVMNTDLGSISEALYEEDAAISNQIKLAISDGKEQARQQLLGSAKTQVKYKDYRKTEQTVPYAVYMMFPLASFNEGLALQNGGICYMPISDGTRKFQKAADSVNSDLNWCPKDSTLKKNLLLPFASNYAKILKDFSNYPTAAWRGNANMNQRNSFANTFKDLYGVDAALEKGGKFNMEDDAPRTEVIYSLLAKSTSVHRMEQPVLFCKAQIDLFCQNPLIDRDINIAIWKLYHDGDDSAVKNLTIDELEKKMADVTKSSNGSTKERKSLSRGEAQNFQNAVTDIIIQRAKAIGVMAPFSEGEGEDAKVLTPDQWTEKLSEKTSWWKTGWNWVCGGIASGLNAAMGVLSMPLKIIAWFLDLVASIFQRLVVGVMVILMGFLLPLQFLLANITLCAVGSKKTEGVFYANLKVCLTLALIPFMCSLLLSIFNLLMNSFYGMLSGGVGATTCGGIQAATAFGKAAVTASSAAASATLQASGIYLILIGMVLSIIQCIAMVFIALYSIRGAKLLTQGGSIAGAFGAAAAGLLAGAMLGGKFASGLGAGKALSSSMQKLAGGAGSAIDAAGQAGETDGGNGDAPGSKVAQSMGGGGGSSGSNSGTPNSVPSPAKPDSPSKDGKKTGVSGLMGSAKEQLGNMAKGAHKMGHDAKSVVGGLGGAIADSKLGRMVKNSAAGKAATKAAGKVGSLASKASSGVALGAKGISSGVSSYAQKAGAWMQAATNKVASTKTAAMFTSAGREFGDWAKDAATKAGLPTMAKNVAAGFKSGTTDTLRDISSATKQMVQNSLPAFKPQNRPTNKKGSPFSGTFDDNA